MSLKITPIFVSNPDDSWILESKVTIYFLDYTRIKYTSA